MDGCEDGQRLLCLVLQSTLDQVLANGSDIVRGCCDEEHVHQLRVGLRRTRTALRDLYLPGMVLDAAREPTLTRVFHRLGEMRDDATVAEVAAPLLEHAGAPKTRWDVPALNAAALADSITDPALHIVLLDLVEFTDLGGLHVITQAEPARAAWRQVERRLARLHRKVLAAAAHFEELPLPEQHRARKRVTRLRYLAEFVGGRWPAKQVQKYLASLKPVQDALCVHIDVATAQRKFMDDARHDPRAYFAAGFLQREIKLTAGTAGSALCQLREAGPFWKR